MIATNAEKIVAARMKGQRPADMVLISLEASLRSNNPVVYAKTELAYDWRWVRDLDVCLYVKDADDWGHMAKDIAMQRPAYFGIWSTDGNWGARVYLIPTAADVNRPVRSWRYDIDFLLWMGFQNEDFLNCRVYARDENGMPYAADN